MGTVEYVDGFDHYVASKATIWGWNVNFSSMQPGRVTGQKARITNNITTSRNLTADTHYTVGCAIWVGNATHTFATLISFLENTIVHGSVSYNGDGTFSVKNGAGTALATSANLGIVADTPYYIEFDYTVDNSTGSYELRVDGAAVIGPTGSTDTRNDAGAVGTINRLRINVEPSQTADYDDLVVTKGGGFQGDCRVVTQMPIGDGANTAWSATGNISPIVVQGTTAPAGSTGTLNVAWPAHQQNDVAILIVESCGGEAASLSTPAGFVACPDSPQATGAGTAGTRLTAFWCRATSGSMATAVIGDAGDHVVGAMITFRGVRKYGSPFDVSAGGVEAGADTSLTATGVTTGEAAEMIVVIATHDLDNAGAQFSSWANAALASITEQMDAGTASGNGGGVAVATGIKAAAGATGNTTATVTSSVNAFLTLALKPQTGDFGVVDDEIVTDDDTSYLSSANATDRDTFTFPALGVTGTIKVIAIDHVSRKDDAGTRKIATSIRRSSTNYDGTGVALSTTYAGYQERWATDPGDGSWLVANLDAGEFGVVVDT